MSRPLDYILASKTAYAVVILAYLLQLVAILYFAVPVPFGDEWEFFRQGASQLPDQLSITWLLQYHNEHMIVFTRLVNWLDFKLLGWHYESLLVFNYAMYGGLLWMLYRTTRNSLPTHRVAVPLYFLLFLLAPQMAENHSWGFQSQFHIVLIGFIANFLLLFDREPTTKHYALAAAISFLGPLCFSAAVPLVLSQALGYALLYWFRSRDYRRPGFWLYMTGSVAGVTVFLLTYEGNAGHIKTYPTDWAFWNYLAAFVAYGAGVKNTHIVASLLGTTLLVLPAIVFLTKLRHRLHEPIIWKSITMVAGVVAIGLITSYGRASFGVGQAKSSRYLEIVSLSAIASYWAYSYILANLSIVKVKHGIATLWIIFAIFYSEGWDYKYSYNSFAKQRIAGQTCIAELARREDAQRCPTIHPGDISSAIEFAKTHQLQFYREAMRATERDPL